MRIPWARTVILLSAATVACARSHSLRTSFPKGPGLLDERPPAKPGAYRLVGWVVSDNSGSPVEGARVMVEGTTVSAETDRFGRYVLADVPSGHDVVKVARIEYGAERRMLTRKRSLEFSMSPAPLPTFTDTLNFWLHHHTPPASQN